MKAMFHLIASSNKQQWTAADLVQLSRDMGEPVSERQASTMVSHISSSNDANAVVTLQDFTNFWSPPDPSV